MWASTRGSRPCNLAAIVRAFRTSTSDKLVAPISIKGPAAQHSAMTWGADAAERDGRTATSRLAHCTSGPFLS